VALSIFLAALILFWGSDSLAQVYKYKDKEGKVTFTDNPTSSLVKDGVSPKQEKAKTETVPNNNKRKSEEIKDFNQLGEELLEKELAKPPEKQDQRLIQELRETLYSDAANKKAQASKDKENKNWNLLNKLGIKTTKSE
jgi:hypothetical protein